MICNALFKSRCIYLVPLRHLSSKLPEHPTVNVLDESKLPKPTTIDSETIKHLERLSLVNFENETGVKIVEDAIRFADRIFEVDTTGVKPMVTVLENKGLTLREDEIHKTEMREELFSHATILEEDYYVAPPGNIPLDRISVEINKK